MSVCDSKTWIYYIPMQISANKITENAIDLYDYLLTTFADKAEKSIMYRKYKDTKFLLQNSKIISKKIDH